MAVRLFKMGGHWIWRCDQHTGGPVGDTYPETGWRSPWDACLSGAVRHHTAFHTEPVQVLDER